MSSIPYFYSQTIKIKRKQHKKILATVMKHYLQCSIFFFKILLVYFLERREGKKKERERNING